MYSGRFTMGAWAHVEEGCSLEYTVLGEQVEMEVGGRDGLYLIASERGLRALSTACAQALADMTHERQAAD